MNIISLSSSDYNQRLDKHIKDAFKNVLKSSHPCEHQNKACLKGSSCPLIGLPEDICTYHLNGKCKYDTSKCKHKHDQNYAKIYRKAKEEFQMEENQPLARFRRYFKILTPYLMGFIGLIFSYIIRRILDYMGKRIF